MKIAAAGYLVLVPKKNSYTGKVNGIAIDRFRTTKPALKSGEIAVRVKLNFESEQLDDAITTVEADINGFRTPVTELFVD